MLSTLRCRVGDAHVDGLTEFDQEISRGRKIESEATCLSIDMQWKTNVYKSSSDARCPEVNQALRTLFLS